MRSLLRNISAMAAIAFLPLMGYAHNGNGGTHATRVYVQRQDTAILFRFVPGKLMFYSPFHDNQSSIKQAAKLIERYRDDIEAGRAFLAVRGYCGSFSNKQENLKAAKNRSNQVKSWFITHHGMKEAYYRTRNYTHDYNGMHEVVALIGIEWADGYEPVVIDNLPPEEPADTAVVTPPAQPEVVETVEPQPEPEPEPTVTEEVSAPDRYYRLTPWYVKSNLLYDAALMPALEVEYRFNQHWSLGVEGAMAWWHNNGAHKYYQLATISPEARYWFKPQGARRGHYVGLFVGGGWYDLENGGKGYKGEGFMTGLSYGYMFPVGKYFAFEAGIGLGYLRTWYEEYLPIDGHYVYQQSSRLNYFGPLKLKFSLVWNIGRWTEKGGKK